MSRTGYVELLRRRPAYRRIWMGSVVSLAGDWFTLIALYTLLNQYTGKGESIGLMLLTRFLPAALLGPIAGVVADRLRRTRVMIACDLARAAIVLGFLLVRSADDVWLVYALTFLQMTAAAFFDPAEQAAIASTVESSELVTANTLQGITWSAMLGIGAVLGGATAALVGRDAAFVVNGATYLLSAFFISRSSVPHTARPSPTSWTGWLGVDDVREGLALLRADATVRRALFVKTAWAIPGGGALVLYATLGGAVFAPAGRPELGIGVLLAMRGLGAFVGPVLARRWGGDAPDFLNRAIGKAFFVTAAFWVGLAVAPSLGVAALMIACAHTGTSVQWVFSSSLISLRVADRLRGRVFAVDFMISTLMLGLSSWATGRLLDATTVGPRGLMASASGVLLLAGAFWWLMGRAEVTEPAQHAGRS